MNDFSPPAFRRWTPARLRLERSGVSLATRPQLEFQWAHARARDAVHAPWSVATTRAEIEALGTTVLEATTMAHSKQEFLLRPDLGRVLETTAQSQLAAVTKGRPFDLVFSVSDGLSAIAIVKHVPAVWREIQREFESLRLRTAPLVLVPFGRVAASDSVGEALGARISIILIGERPGLSSAESLGIYVTYAPRIGTSDAQRNCISNIHPPDGLGYAEAAGALRVLVERILRGGISGVALEAIASSDSLPGKTVKA